MPDMNNPIPLPPQLLQMIANRQSPQAAGTQAFTQNFFPGANQGIQSAIEGYAKNKQRQAWQKTINQMMSDPSLPPQLKAIAPSFAQHPELMGQLGPSILKSEDPSQTIFYDQESGRYAPDAAPGYVPFSTTRKEATRLLGASAGKPGKPGMVGMVGQNLGEVSWDKATPDEQAFAKGLYNGDIDASTMGYRERSKYMMLANQYATRNNLPPYQSFSGHVKGKTASAFTSGKPALNTLALNTALSHLDSAYEAYKNIENTNQAWLNQPMNKLKKATGDPNVTNLMATLNAVRGESANVFKGSGATDQEIASWRESINENMTPAQYLGIIGQMDELYRSRLDALKYMRSQGMGNRPGSGSLLSPHGSAISKKLGGGKKSSDSGWSYVGPEGQ